MECVELINDCEWIKVKGNLISNEDEPKLLIVLDELVWLIKWNASECIQNLIYIEMRIFRLWINLRMK